jgi:hypothetical protein
MNRLLSSRFTRIIPLIISILTILTIFVSKGPIEGAQRDIGSVESRSDWWGPIPPIFYGTWPIGNNNWDISLSILQVLMFHYGFQRLITYEKICQNIKSLVFYCSLLLSGSIFCSQLWRDSTLLSFVVFGLAITKEASKRTAFRKTLLIAGALVLIIGSLCKVIFSPLVAVYYVFTLRQTFKFPKHRAMISMLLILFFSTTSVLLNSSLSRAADLKSTYPEQQPMIFDLASMYCWGTSLQSNQDAINVLRVTKRVNYPDEAICSSLEPMGWDTLRMDRPPWEYSSPIIPLSKLEDSEFLTKGWIRVILTNPTEYLQIKLLHSTQVLTMANYLGPRTERKFDQFALPNIVQSIVSGYMFIPRILDRLRIFSLGTLILALIVLIWKKSLESRANHLKDPHPGVSNYSILSVAILQLILTTVGFVSGNGRYSFPFVFLGLVFLINQFETIGKLRNFKFLKISLSVDN